MKRYAVATLLLIFMSGLSQEHTVSAKGSVPEYLVYFNPENTAIDFVSKKMTAAVLPFDTSPQFNIPKIDFTEKKTYYFKNDFSGGYESYIFYGNELRRDKNYLTYYEIAPSCPAAYQTPDPYQGGDIAGALISSLIDNFNLHFKIGKVKFSVE